MSYKDLDHQMELVAMHIAKANQCHEYGKPEDAEVHTKIAEILLRGINVKKHQMESLDNLAQALA